MVVTRSAVGRHPDEMLSVRSFVGRTGAHLDRHLGALFLVPGCLVLLLIIAYPIVANVWLSMSDAHLVYPGTSFIGAENFAELLRSPRFGNAVKNSILWTVGSVSLQLIVGLGAALLLNRPIRLGWMFRTLLFIPYAFPPITVAFIWRWMLNGLFGVANSVLIRLGILEQPISWLGDSRTALLTVILINVWFGFPLFALAILAGLQSIPGEHYEVAAIEGSTALQSFWYVTLPVIRTIIGIMLILRTIWVFNAFDFIWLLTGGGPGRVTETLPVLAYVTGWRQYFLGETAAIALMLFGFLAVMATGYFRLFRYTLGDDR